MWQTDQLIDNVVDTLLISLSDDEDSEQSDLSDAEGEVVLEGIEPMTL